MCPRQRPVCLLRVTPEFFVVLPYMGIICAASNHLLQIQALVDKLNLGEYSNLPSWVARLDERVGGILCQRLEAAVRLWIASFSESAAASRAEEGSNIVAARRGSGSGVVATTRSDGVDKAVGAGAAGLDLVRVTPVVHEVVLRNRVIQLQPPLEASREVWLEQLHELLSTACDQPHITSDRYDQVLRGQAGSGAGDGAAGMTRSARPTRGRPELLGRLSDGLLASAFQAVEAQLDRVRPYVAMWLRYQVYWDLEAGEVERQLAGRLELWQQLLQQVQSASPALESGRQVASFGPSTVAYVCGVPCHACKAVPCMESVLIVRGVLCCVVLVPPAVSGALLFSLALSLVLPNSFAQVQAKVSHKHDAWLRDFLAKFATLVSASMSPLSTTLRQARKELDEVSVSGAGGSVAFVTLVGRMRAAQEEWAQQLSVLEASERLLQTSNASLPDDWLWFSRVEGQWAHFLQQLERRSATLDAQLPVIRTQVEAEAKSLTQRVDDVSSEWDGDKPLAEDMPPARALEVLNAFETKLQGAQSRWQELRAARETLLLSTAGDRDRVAPMLDELCALRGAWSALQAPWAELDALRETPWAAVVPRKVKQQLARMLDVLRALPGEVQQYEMFEAMRSRLQGYRRPRGMLAELKSEAVKERHWAAIMRALKLRVPMSRLTLGRMWDAGLVKHEVAVREVLQAAQGEMGLAQFLSEVEEAWTTRQFDTTTYRNKCKLIRKWDDLFDELDEHLSALGSMKLSPCVCTVPRRSISALPVVVRARCVSLVAAACGCVVVWWCVECRGDTGTTKCLRSRPTSGPRP